MALGQEHHPERRIWGVMRRRSSALTLLLAILLSTLAIPAATAAPCGDAYVPLRMFKVETKWERKTYAIGDTAKLKVTVSRVADEDPVTDDGQPWPTGRPIDEPAPDVSMGVGLMVGDVYLTGGAVTDQAGKATIPIKIESYTKPGKAASRIYAEKILIKDFPSSACRIVIKEYGYVDPGPALTITK